MPILRVLEQRWGAYLRTAMDRVRAAGWRARGASLGAKCRVGKSCVIERPWRLSTAQRVQFEHSAYIKIVDDTAHVSLGSFTFIGFGTELDIAGDLRIGSHVLIAPGCFITDHEHGRAAGIAIDAQGTHCRPVSIGDDVWLGARVVALPGVTIGDGAIVGAGAVVTHDVAPGAIVAGVPARSIGVRA